MLIFCVFYDRNNIPQLFPHETLGGNWASRHWNSRSRSKPVDDQACNQLETSVFVQLLVIVAKGTLLSGSLQGCSVNATVVQWDGIQTPGRHVSLCVCCSVLATPQAVAKWPDCFVRECTDLTVLEMDEALCGCNFRIPLEWIHTAVIYVKDSYSSFF